MKKGKNIIDKLADAALQSRFLRDGVSAEYDRPGRIIESLSPEKRKELHELTSDDLQNVRWPRPDGVNLEKMPRRLR